MSKQPPPAPTASAIGPCPTIIQIVLDVYPGLLHHPTPTAVIEAKRVGGNDAVELHKAKRRGKAYMCLHCFHKLGRKVTEVAF